MSTNHGFPPIAAPDARILILGSMPGKRSLEKYQYYAHPRNSFWPIMRRLLSADAELNYNDRKNLLLTNKIAVWDVLKSCYRKGSLDADIDQSSVEPNHFRSFLTEQNNITHIFFNGAKAAQLFNKNVLNTLGEEHQNLGYIKLPSTSPAHAAMTMQQKLLTWQIIKQFL